MAKKINNGNFIDLGDEPIEMPATKNSKPTKYYPSIRMRKSGIKKGVGKYGTAIVKFKVRSVEMRDGQPPETCLEFTGIKEQE
jgi:hypothetical protein